MLTLMMVLAEKLGDHNSSPGNDAQYVKTVYWISVNSLYKISRQFIKTLLRYFCNKVADWQSNERIAFFFVNVVNNTHLGENPDTSPHEDAV